MKTKGKRILLVILTLVLIMLYVLCGELGAGSNEAADEQTEDVLNNEALTMEVSDDGDVSIKGEGSLDRHDFLLLLGEHGMAESDINCLTIGGGIDEIGYNCVNQLGYLQTLIVEKGVVRISNGAVRNCEDLRWVYLPNSVQRIGRDFLYGCSKAVVLTDGTADELPEMGNYSSSAIIEKVLDYSSLLHYEEDAQEHPGFDFVFLWALKYNVDADIEEMESTADGLASEDELASSRLFAWCSEDDIVSSGTDEEFVDYCYNKLLGRNESDDERTACVNSLAGGTTREATFSSFLKSEEFRNRQGM